MNERTLLILAAVGASVVAYAVYALLSRELVERQPASTVSSDPARAVSTSPRSAERRSTSSQRRRPVGGRVETPVRESPTKPSGGPPHPVPMPEVSVEEARQDYDDFIGELERELQRSIDTGKVLANEHWVDYYRRGHEIMEPLRRYMSTGTDAERKEVGELDEALRTLMSKLQRDPSTLEGAPE